MRVQGSLPMLAYKTMLLLQHPKMLDYQACFEECLRAAFYNSAFVPLPIIHIHIQSKRRANQMIVLSSWGKSEVCVSNIFSTHIIKMPKVQRHNERGRYEFMYPEVCRFNTGRPKCAGEQ
jgi:hypothetical protein